jgi:Putative beta-barrel porin-2, OmpL-like. bbp2
MRRLHTVQLSFVLLAAMCGIAQAQEGVGTTIASRETTTSSLDTDGSDKPLDLMRACYLRSTSLNVNQARLIKDTDPAFSCGNQPRTSGRSFLDKSATQQEPAEEQVNQRSDPKWQYGGFVDLAYPLDFNHPQNRLFRSRGTAFRMDNVWLNMAAFYVRKKPSKESRWGVELTAQAGKDAEFFGFSATAPNIAGYKFLRQLGPTNVSYLAPVGKGLTVQAGIFSSLIGYDSLYAKDNFNYTRPWGADFTPYFMMGANVSYPFTEKLTGTFFLVNGYWHLARANSAPSAGGQIAYKLTPHWTIKETTLFGPHQRNTSFEFWRFLTDTIVERKTGKFTFASEYIFSTERVDTVGKPRALMMSWQLPTRWTINDRWSLSFRPEVFWDRDGRWTLARQTVKAFTSTVEYRLPYRWTTTIFRLEHRFDDSRGPDGGFFRGRELSPGVVGLTPSQHLLIFATIFTFDSPPT